MRKGFLTIILVINIITLSSAQDYKTAIGLRGGLESGLTLKHFVNKNDALEGLLSRRWRGLNLTALYEIHNRAFGIHQLNWYYGCGAHIGLFSGSDTDSGRITSAYVVLGVDAIIGIEYNFDEIPVNISLDWKPAYNLIGYSGFWGDTGGLSVRYVF